MSASDNCLIFTCFQNCCNINGICPTNFGTFGEQNCVYYYDNFFIWLTWWIWVIIGVGSLLFILCIVCCVVACVRSQRKNQDLIVVNDTQPRYQGQYQQDPNQQGQYQQGYNQQGYNQNQNYEMNQINHRPTIPTMGEPVYQNGPNVALAQNNENIYL